MGMLSSMESLTQKITDNQATTRKTIADVQIGLSTGDVTRLQRHAGALQDLTRNLRTILPT